jgi:hypothetical protein
MGIGGSVFLKVVTVIAAAVTLTFAVLLQTNKDPKTKTQTNFILWLLIAAIVTFVFGLFATFFGNSCPKPGFCPNSLSANATTSV